MTSCGHSEEISHRGKLECRFLWCENDWQPSHDANAFYQRHQGRRHTAGEAARIGLEIHRGVWAGKPWSGISQIMQLVDPLWHEHVCQQIKPTWHIIWWLRLQLPIWEVYHEHRPDMRICNLPRTNLAKVQEPAGAGIHNIKTRT